MRNIFIKVTKNFLWWKLFSKVGKVFIKVTKSGKSFHQRKFLSTVCLHLAVCLHQDNFKKEWTIKNWHNWANVKKLLEEIFFDENFSKVWKVFIKVSKTHSKTRSEPRLAGKKYNTGKKNIITSTISRSFSCPYFGLRK